MPQISIVKLSEVEKDGRFDAEFYKPEYLKSDRIINKFKDVKTIKEISEIITNGHTPRYADLTKGEIKFLTAENIFDLEINSEETKFIFKKPHLTELKRTIIEKGDILVTIKGRIGNFAVVNFETDKRYNINQDVGRIKIKKGFNPFYISAFLNSFFGKNQSYRISTGQINPFLGLGNLEKLKIPILPVSFQQKIETIVKDSYSKLQTSKQLYKEAEEILLKELGLENYKPKHELTFSSKLSEVLDAERIDADYFQPKYKEIEKKIEGYKGGFFTLSDEEINNKNFFPKADKEYCYIELSNVSGNGEINGFTKDLGANLPTRARRKLKEGNVIISSIEGSLNSCALITKDYENCLCSNGFFVLNSNKLNPETLLVLSKSLIIQKLLERGCKGTILTAIGKNELQKIKIPLLPSTIQEKISSKIQESFKLRKESKELLEKAKKMVEDEIEREAK